MVKINLVRKDKMAIKRVDQLKKISVWVTGITLVGFLLQVVFLTGRTAYLSWKGNNLDKKISNLKVTLSGREEEMVKYDGVKRRLEFILKEREDSYEYTAYLSEISSWLPSGAGLAAISFVNKEDIAFTLKAEDTDIYRDLEERLVNLDLEESDSLFSGLKQQGVNRNGIGEYLLRIIGRIK